MKIEFTESQYEKIVEFIESDLSKVVLYIDVQRCGNEEIESINKVLSVQSLLRHVLSKDENNHKSIEQDIIKCKHCGHPVNGIEVPNIYSDGTVHREWYPVKAVGNTFATMELNRKWLGAGFPEETAMKTIHCTNCGKFPFSETQGLNTRTIIRVDCIGELTNGNTECTEL